MLSKDINNCSKCGYKRRWGHVCWTNTLVSTTLMKAQRSNKTSKTKKEILSNYTFYSHVGNALALWRNTRAPAFWKKWEAKHPFKAETDEVAVNNTTEAGTDEATTDAPTKAEAAEEAETVDGKEPPAEAETDVEPKPLIVPPEL